MSSTVPLNYLAPLVGHTEADTVIDITEEGTTTYTREAPAPLASTPLFEPRRVKRRLSKVTSETPRSTCTESSECKFEAERLKARAEAHAKYLKSKHPSASAPPESCISDSGTRSGSSGITTRTTVRSGLTTTEYIDKAGKTVLMLNKFN